jgi:hypothetical protein
VTASTPAPAVLAVFITRVLMTSTGDAMAVATMAHTDAARKHTPTAHHRQHLHATHCCEASTVRRRCLHCRLPTKNAGMPPRRERAWAPGPAGGARMRGRRSGGVGGGRGVGEQATHTRTLPYRTARARAAHRKRRVLAAPASPRRTSPASARRTPQPHARRHSSRAVHAAPPPRFRKLQKCRVIRDAGQLIWLEQQHHKGRHGCPQLQLPTHAPAPPCS